jgi:hypothetical protein
MSIHTKHMLQEIAYIVATLAIFALIGVMLAWRG